MITAIIAFVCIATYATIGTLYGAWLFPQLDGNSRSYDASTGMIGCYPFDEDGVAMVRGIFWPIFMTWTLMHIPGKYLVRAGIWMGEQSLQRQQEAIQHRKRIAAEQNKLRIETQQFEEAAEREAEECMQQSNHI